MAEYGLPDYGLLNPVEEVLYEDEGYRRKPYRDTEGNMTIGVGHLMLPDEINEMKVGMLEGGTPDSLDPSWSKGRIKIKFGEDLNSAKKDVRAILKEKKIDVGSLPPGVEDEFILMAYQMGHSSLLGFKNMWDGVKSKNWKKVQREMKDSAWYNQTTSRANRAIWRMGERTRGY
jgi:lysozyme